VGVWETRIACRGQGPASPGTPDAGALVDKAHQAVGGQLLELLARPLAGEIEPAGDIARARRAARLQKEQDLFAGRIHARSSLIRHNAIV